MEHKEHKFYTLVLDGQVLCHDFSISNIIDLASAVRQDNPALIWQIYSDLICIYHCLEADAFKKELREWCDKWHNNCIKSSSI